MSTIRTGPLKHAENVLPSQLSGPALKTVQRPSVDDWERLRPIIRRLYIDEGRPLKDVMNTMINEYGHNATIKMYKSRLVKYGMYKHNRACDIAFVIRKKRQRDAQGKRSSFAVRSKKISAKEIDRYIQRKRGQDPDFKEAPADTPTPVHIMCLSLPSSPSPEGGQGNPMIHKENRTLTPDTSVAPDRPRKRKRSTSFIIESRSNLVSQRAYSGVRGRARSPSVPAAATAPEIFLKHELLFTTISNYIVGSIENGTWFTSKSGQLRVTKQTADPAYFQNLFCKRLNTSRYFHSFKVVSWHPKLSLFFLQYFGKRARGRWQIC